MPFDGENPDRQAEQEEARRAARRRQRRAVRRKIEQSIAGALHETTRAVVVLVGAGLLTYGAGLAWRPAGALVAGALLIAGVWLHDRQG